MVDRAKYPTHIFYSDDDEGYIAVVPDLPGCSAFGETKQTALEELEHAIEAWILAAEKAGNPIPAPSQAQPQPAVSGKILIRIPRSLHWQLVEGARRESTSLNQYIMHLLTLASACDVLTEAVQTVSSNVARIVASTGTAGPTSHAVAFLSEHQTGVGVTLQTHSLGPVRWRRHEHGLVSEVFPARGQSIFGADYSTTRHGGGTRHG